MTAAGIARYRRENPGSKLQSAVTKNKGLTKKEKAISPKAKCPIKFVYSM